MNIHHSFSSGSGAGVELVISGDSLVYQVALPQPKASKMLRGQFRGISEAKMLECMNRLGRDVEIVVRKPSRSRATGQTRVVFA